MHGDTAHARPLRVAVLSHCQIQAQEVVQTLQAALQAHPGADPLAVHWLAACLASEADGCDLCLLLPWDQSGDEAIGLENLHAHQALRLQLQERGQAFAALRGDRSRLTDQALALLSRSQPALRPENAQILGRPGWSSWCDNCDDPDCELRLFRDAGASREGPASRQVIERPKGQALDQPDR